MRAIVSILSLLLVVAVVGMLAKSQLKSVSAISVKPPEGVPLAMPSVTPGANPQQQREQMGQQITQTINAALQPPRPVVDDQ